MVTSRLAVTSRFQQICAAGCSPAMAGCSSGVAGSGEVGRDPMHADPRGSGRGRPDLLNGGAPGRPAARGDALTMAAGREKERDAREEEEKREED